MTRAFAPRTPPAWLQEGVAQVLADQLGPEQAQTLARGSMTGLVSLEGLEHGFPSDPRRAQLAYAESAERAIPILRYRADRGIDYLMLAAEIFERLGMPEQRGAVESMASELAAA